VAEFVEVGKVTELQDGAMKEFSIGGINLLVARAGENFYAAENRCPHLGAKLTPGTLQGSIVTCPRHGSQFDLTDGKVIRWTDWPGLISSLNRTLRPPRSLKVYRTKVEGEKILVEV
jgi:3-phenylpropionate/trans-cinnamate dioxygenase ferredoxin subunit